MTDAAPPATLVWASPQPPSAAAARSLAAWARAHGVVLNDPADVPLGAVGVEGASAASAAIAIAIANEVEELLDRAEDAIAAHEADAVERALAAAETRLRAHASLPQAAWLMAEVERARSARWRRVPPIDVEASERAWQRAEALDGGRVTGIGEQASAAHAPAVTLEVTLPADDQLQIDGRLVPAGPAGTAGRAGPATRATRDASVETRAGAHAVVVKANGEAVWAGWLDAEPGRGRLPLDAPAIVPCSTADVARAFGTREDHTGAWLGPERVTCPRWVVAEDTARDATGADGGNSASSDAARGGVRVATCEAGRCGDWAEWHAWGDDPRWRRDGTAEPVATTGAPDASNTHGRPRLPAWAIWTIGGVAAAGAALVVVIASGVLQAAPTETRFVNGGLKTQ